MDDSSIDNFNVKSLYDKINQLETKYQTQQNLVKQLESQIRKHDNQIMCNSSNIEANQKAYQDVMTMHKAFIDSIAKLEVKQDQRHNEILTIFSHPADIHLIDDDDMSDRTYINSPPQYIQSNDDDISVKSLETVTDDNEHLPNKYDNIIINDPDYHASSIETSLPKRRYSSERRDYKQG